MYGQKTLCCTMLHYFSMFNFILSIITQDNYISATQVICVKQTVYSYAILVTHSSYTVSHTVQGNVILTVCFTVRSPKI